MDNEKKEKAKESYMELQMVNKQLQQMQKQLELSESQLDELRGTLDALTELNEVKEGTTLWVPVSSGIFTKAKLGDKSQLLLNVGSGALVKKTVDDAKKLITAQLTEIEQMQRSMFEYVQKLALRGTALEEELQKLAAE